MSDESERMLSEFSKLPEQTSEIVKKLDELIDDFSDEYLESLYRRSPLPFLKASLLGIDDLRSLENIFLDEGGKVVFLDIDGMANIGLLDDDKEFVAQNYQELRAFVNRAVFSDAIKYKAEMLKVFLGDGEELQSFNESCARVKKFFENAEYQEESYPSITEDDVMGVAAQLRYSPDSKSLEWVHANDEMHIDNYRVDVNSQHSFFTEERLGEIRGRLKGRDFESESGAQKPSTKEVSAKSANRVAKNPKGFHAP